MHETKDLQVAVRVLKADRQDFNKKMHESLNEALKAWNRDDKLQHSTLDIQMYVKMVASEGFQVNNKSSPQAQLHWSHLHT